MFFKNVAPLQLRHFLIAFANTLRANRKDTEGCTIWNRQETFTRVRNEIWGKQCDRRCNRMTLTAGKLTSRLCILKHEISRNWYSTQPLPDRLETTFSRQVKQQKEAHCVSKKCFGQASVPVMQSTLLTKLVYATERDQRTSENNYTAPKRN